MRTSGLGEKRGNSTKGVLPIDSTMSPKRPPQGLLSSSSRGISFSRYFKKYSHGYSLPGRVMCAMRKEVAPAGSAAGHRGQDDDGVAIADRGLEPVQHPHVLVVEVDVDVAVEVALGAEELLFGGRVLGGQRSQHLADVGAGGVNLGLAPGLGTQYWWDANRCHRSAILLKAACGGLAGAKSVVVRELAEILVGDLGRIGAANWAAGVAANLELGEAGAERLEEQKATDQRLADPQHQL